TSQGESALEVCLGRLGRTDDDVSITEGPQHRRNTGTVARFVGKLQRSFQASHRLVVLTERRLRLGEVEECGQLSGRVAGSPVAAGRLAPARHGVAECTPLERVQSRIEGSLR